MSSAYPPYGGAPTQVCQRCGASLPPNEVYCGNCGYYNAPAQGTVLADGGQPASNTPWGVPPTAYAGGVPPTAYAGGSPSTTYGQNQYGGSSWGQQPAPPVQNDPYAQSPFPQQAGSGNYYGAPAQPMANGNYFGAPSPAQPASSDNYYGASGQQQPYYGAPSAPMMPGSFQAGGMNIPQTPGLNPQMPQRSGMKTGPMIAIGVLVAVLIVGGLGYALLSRHSSNTPTTSTSSATTAASTPTPSAPPKFADSFANNSNGWNLQGDPGHYSVALGNGSLALEDDNNRLLWELIPGGRTFSDFKLNVDATLSKGTQENGYGIYIRGASNQNTELATYYRFELYGDGSFAVFKGTVDANGNSTATKIVDYTDSPAIQKQGGMNHISVVASGPSITLIVNGQTLKTISDSSYTSGSVALFVSNLEGSPPGAQAKFSNLAIYSPN